MCGIIGYTGPLDAKRILLDGLAGLEYRGYDSAGIALCMVDSRIELLKKVGKVSNLREYCNQKITAASHCGIGHTRWATHGRVTDENAHPHRAGRITLIHNGIIENYHELTEKFHLADELVSQTDSEVAARVLDRLYEGDPLAALRELSGMLEGSYGFCVMFDDQPGNIYAMRRQCFRHGGHPLIAVKPYGNISNIRDSQTLWTISHTVKIVLLMKPFYQTDIWLPPLLPTGSSDVGNLNPAVHRFPELLRFIF